MQRKGYSSQQVEAQLNMASFFIHSTIDFTNSAIILACNAYF